MESSFCFQSGSSELIGILHESASNSTTGVLIVVGGPQYRVGSHRQFVLLARYLAEHGIPVLRFDYSGMGDSEGHEADFEKCNQDIRNAIDIFFQKEPRLEQIVIWGLCDAASAALFYAYTDTRVTGLILLNPWLRTEAGMAKAYIKHYYLRRIFSGELWRKLFSGKFNFAESMKSLINFLGKMRSANSPQKRADVDQLSLPDRMLNGFTQFHGAVVFILSENDYAADEFRDVVQDSREWQILFERDNVKRINSPDSDHTFSSKHWRDKVAVWTREWVEQTFDD